MTVLNNKFMSPVYIKISIIRSQHAHI